MSGSTDLYKEFIACTQEERRLKDELSALKDLKRTLVDDILTAFAEDGITQMTLDADGIKATIYPHETLRARALEGDQERLNDTLRANGFEHLIKETVNSQTLSAFVREQLAEDTLPADIKSALDVYSDLSVRVRSSARTDSASSRALRNLNN